MLKRYRILKILVPTPHNTRVQTRIFKIRDGLSIEIAKTKCQKGGFYWITLYVQI
jgi:hypothetical protein